LAAKAAYYSAQPERMASRVSRFAAGLDSSNGFGFQQPAMELSMIIFSALSFWCVPKLGLRLVLFIGTLYLEF
jgi:hypothetical protein